MNFSQLAYLNVSRNKKLYLGYFLSNAFSVMVFFTFLVFALHPQLIGAHPFVTVGMLNAAIVIVVFSIFYIGYSMSAFLQMRKKEFGILMMNGLSPKQLRTLVFRENTIIGFLANIAGIILGIPLILLITFFSKSFIMVDLQPYFPLMAIFTTVILFTVMFGALSYFICLRLSRQKLLTLIKSDKTAVPLPKTSVLRVIIAFLFLGGGYAIALSVQSGAVVLALLPVMFLVIVGTYYFFTQALVFLAKTMKERPHTFFKKKNILLLSDMSFRVKENAQSFFFITIITTVVFAAMGSLFSFQEFFTKTIDTTYDISFQTPITFQQQSGSWELVESTVLEADPLATFLQVRGIQFDDEAETTFIALSDYNIFAKASQEQTLLLSEGNARYFEKGGLAQSGEVTDNSGQLDAFNLTSVGESQSNVIPHLSSYFVVSDSDFARLTKQNPQHFLILAANTTTSAEVLLPFLETLDTTLQTVDPDAFLMSSKVSMYQLYVYYGPILFIGIFISIVFFLSAGSFLYFRLYRDIEQDYQKFYSIAKIGLTDKELTSVVTKQLAMLFGIPLIIASSHGVVALIAMAALFMEPLTFSAIIVVITFIVIQLFYFFIARFFYLKKLRNRLFTTN